MPLFPSPDRSDASPPPTPHTDDRTPGWMSPLLKTGVAFGGLYAGLAVAHRIQHARLPAASTLPHALTADARTVDVPHGRVNYYVRPGVGTPVVLLHSFNAAASPFEMLPIFDRVARGTDRPIYAMDWLGFGRSDRGDRPYTPDFYADQLYRFLTDVVGEPADLVALSLGCEIAATVTLHAAPQVRRLVLVSPTGMTATRGPSSVGATMLSLAGATGLFEALYYPLTRRASLRRFYARQVFADADAVPAPLVDYAHVTSHARDAHYAPLQFVNGTLFQPNVADDVYARLYRPTLVLTPTDPSSTVQRFDRLRDVLDANPRDLTHQPLPGGLMPHWEAPNPFFRALERFWDA